MAESNITDIDLEEQTTKQTYILDSMHTETFGESSSFKSALLLYLDYNLYSRTQQFQHDVIYRVIAFCQQSLFHPTL